MAGAVPEPAENSDVHRTVASLGEFAEEVNRLAAEGCTIWFRGARDVKYDLRPSLFRHPSFKTSVELLNLEWQLLSDYRHQALPFTARMPHDDLEMLFLMQHYGVPTRLLDWTENPFVALFFATENARDESAGAEKDAAVWIINPIELNKRTFPTRSNADRILGAYAGELNGLRPASRVDAIDVKTPCAIFGVHNTPRIVAQRGSFVLYGNDVASMDSQAVLKLTEDKVLRKIVVSGSSKRAIFSHLFNMGISDSVVYPDLEGLSREIRNRRGFAG